MKSTKEIIGLRIISVADGTQVGLIKDLVLNPQGGSLDFFIVDQPTDYFGAKIITFTDILGLGEFAVTIPDPKVIQDVAQNLAAQELLKQDVRVIGTKVLTKKGKLIGEVIEILIDEETGKIDSCIFINSENKEEMKVNSRDIVTYGKELLIIEESNSFPKEIIEEEIPSSSQNNLEGQVVEEKILDVNSANESETEFNLFEQRQLQYFIGKMVEKDIILDDGDLLKAGEPMSEETVRKITTRSKMMEITSHLKKAD